MRRTAALIVGGGPAGAAAAITLAGGGVRPLLLERDREVGDALCGGFLSWRTLAALEALGIDPDMLGGARIDRLRIFAANQFAETSLPRPAHGLSRRALDSALLAEAERRGTAVERGVRVSEASDHDVRLADGGEVAAEALFLGTGKHDLRGLSRPGDAAGLDPTLGLRVRIAPAAALAALVTGVIELHLFDRGYVGLVLQEDGSANLCLAVRKSRLGEAGNSPAALLAELGQSCPRLGERLAYMPAAPAIDAIASVPYGWRAHGTVAGVFRLGDQSGVIPSLAGEGIGIALASGAAAGEAYLRDGASGAEAYQRRFAARLARPIGLATLLRDWGERPVMAKPATALLARLPALARIAARGTRISI